MSGPRITLASASPRRADCLRILGIDFDVCPADIDETRLPGESPEAHVERLARRKADAAAAGAGGWVIGGDTVVVFEGDILGKPVDEGDAVRMLMRLSGRAHFVFSGLAIRSPDGEMHSGVSVTEVEFAGFGESLARAYARTGEPLDKAGGYGIQGKGSALVEGIRGDYYTVVGLPTPLMLALFRAAGWRYAFGEWERL